MEQAPPISQKTYNPHEVSDAVMRTRSADNPDGPNEPIRIWQRIVSMCLLMGLCLAVMALFSQTFGTGDDIINFLTDKLWFSYMCFAAASGLSLCLYLLDFSYWTSSFGVVMRRLGVSIVVILGGAAAIFSMREYPQAPLAICLLGLPLAAVVMRSLIFPNNSVKAVSYVTGVNFLVTALVCIIVWLIWLFGGWRTGNEYNNHWYENRASFAADAHCYRFDAGTYTIGEDDTTICLAAFLLWISPTLLFAVCLFFGVFLVLLARILSAKHSSSHTTKFATKMLIWAVIISFLGMYSASSIGGANMQLTNAAYAVYGAGLFGIVLIVGSTLGWSTLNSKINEQPFIKKLHQLGPPYLDIAHAMVISLGLGPFLIFLGLSFLNQQLRKLPCCFPCKKLTPEERKYPFTSVAMHKLNAIMEWDWVSALSWAMLLCKLFWALKWGTTLTYIFLNWLISVLQPLNWGLVAVIFIAIGLTGFLIPVVPGPAVYLTSGVLLVPVLESAWGGASSVGGSCNVSAVESFADDEETGGAGMAFWLAVLFANAVSYILKFVAHVMQQKCIGEAFGSSPKVRSLVSPNSRLMKATRWILEQKGVTKEKVCIMCGGPDWPTSVICGLLKISVWQGLLGLIPMFTLTIPITLAGAFMTKSGFPFDSLPALCLGVSAFEQIFLAVGFFHYIDIVLVQQADAISAYKDDPEVKAIDERAAAQKQVRQSITKLEVMPVFAKTALFSSAAIMTLTCYALQFTSSRLFQPFDLTSCQDTLGESPYDVIPAIGVSRWGMAALVLLLISLVLEQIYKCWVRAAVRKRLRDSKEDPSDAKINTPSQVDA